MSGSWDFGGGATSSGSEDSWGDISAPTPAPASSFGQGGFGGEPGERPTPTSGGDASAPVIWLIVGIAVALIAIIAAVATNSVGISIGAWALGGPVAIGLLAVFVNADNNARANPWYADSEASAWGRRLLVLLALVAVGLNAWTIADYMARGAF